MLFALDPNEDLIDEESVSVSLVPPSKSLGVFGPKLDPPQSDRLVADRDPTLGHEIREIVAAQIEAMIEPDCVLDYLRQEAVTFVNRCELVHSTIVVQTHLTCQYPNKGMPYRTTRLQRVVSLDA